MITYCFPYSFCFEETAFRISVKLNFSTFNFKLDELGHLSEKKLPED